MSVRQRGPRSWRGDSALAHGSRRFSELALIQEMAGSTTDAARKLVIGVLKRTIRLYQLTLSPLVGGRCRFHPTCSNYALEVIERHGPLAGAWLALKRLLKCHPFHPGGVDPPPSSGG